MKIQPKYFKWIFISFSTCLYYHIGYVIVRSQFELLLIDFSAFFLLYFLAIKFLEFNWFTAIFLRLVLIASTPTLSDDYFRFIWDGNLLLNGQNPFRYLPSELPKNEIYDGLNSKNYYSVYPPLLQLIFGFSSFVANGNVLANIITMRIIIILADLGSIYLIIKLLGFLNLPKKQAQFFALNPLIILELTGNLHFEGVTLFFVLLAIYVLLFYPKSVKNIAVSAFSLVMAVLIKLLPLIFIPLIINHLGWKKGLFYSAFVMTIVVLAFVPFFNYEMILHISNSLNLYFQKFEFNASLYYIVKWLGIFLNNNNPIQVAGPLLTLFGGALILWISFLSKKPFDNFNTKLLFLPFIYLLMATTVHPWYICTLVGLGCLTHFRFAIVWSWLCILSYSAYQSSIYVENLWLIAIEYLIVFGIMVWEINVHLKTKFN
jgi:alpha-1,6-mannosyltransferase